MLRIPSNVLDARARDTDLISIWIIRTKSGLEARTNNTPDLQCVLEARTNNMLDLQRVAELLLTLGLSFYPNVSPHHLLKRA